MKIVCLVLVGIVVAQNLHRLKQVRTLMFLLILSGLAAAAFTAWQYTYGVGVRVAYACAERRRCISAHVYQDDIIPTHQRSREYTRRSNCRGWSSKARRARCCRLIWCAVTRFTSGGRTFVREQMIESGLGTPALPLPRGQPLKAQGAARATMWISPRC